MKNKWNLQFRLGVFFTSIFILLGLFGPLLSPYSTSQIYLELGLCSPSKLHWLGCDSNGVDVLSILMNGARTSLAVSVLATLLSASIGLFVGSIAGYYEGWCDTVVSRIVDTVLAFPGILLTIAFASLIEPGYGSVILCLSAASWAGFSRIVRGEVIRIRKLDFVDSARAIGTSNPRIITRHIWPNLMPTLLVSTSYGLASNLLAEASLAFLGLGIPVKTTSWGALLNFGRDVLVEAPHVAMAPGVAIFVSALGFHLLGEGIRIRLDPKT